MDEADRCDRLAAHARGGDHRGREPGGDYSPRPARQASKVPSSSSPRLDERARHTRDGAARPAAAASRPADGRAPLCRPAGASGAAASYTLESNPSVSTRVAVPLVGLFPLILMFLVTSIAMLRERTGGTLERLMSLPLSRLDLLAGYGLAFSVARRRAGRGDRRDRVPGARRLLRRLACRDRRLRGRKRAPRCRSRALPDAFATSEFQAVQFMPAVILPQILLCGLFVPRGRMPHALRIVSDALPVSYAYDALARVSAGEGAWSSGATSRSSPAASRSPSPSEPRRSGGGRPDRRGVRVLPCPRRTTVVYVSSCKPVSG